jgi:hypothetical protein
MPLVKECPSTMEIMYVFLSTHRGSKKEASKPSYIFVAIVIPTWASYLIPSMLWVGGYLLLKEKRWENERNCNIQKNGPTFFLLAIYS